MASKASNDGGYDAKFVEDVPEFLQCIVCQLALRKPVLVIDCGHGFCECCFEKMKLYSISSALDLVCPLDRQLIDPSKVFPDKRIERLVFDLKVKCDNIDQGCDWIGDLRALKVHLNTDCLFEMDSCIHNGCTVKMERGKLKDHMKICLKDGNVSERLWNIVTTLTQRMDNYEEEMRKKDDKIEDCNKQIQEKEKVLQKYNNDLQETKNNLKQVEERLEIVSKNSIKCLNCVEQHEMVLNVNKDCIERNFKDFQETKEGVKKFDKKMNCLVEEMKQLREESSENNVKYQKECEIKNKYEEELQEYSNELHDYIKYQDEYNTVISNLINVITDKQPLFKWLIRDYATESIKGDRLFSPSFYTADGYHLKLMVRWFGAMQKTLDLGLVVFKSEKTKDRAPFKRKVSFDCQDRFKVMVSGIEIESNFNEEQSTWAATGVAKFLTMPALKECIIDDTLSIVCSIVQ